MNVAVVASLLMKVVHSILERYILSSMDVFCYSPDLIHAEYPYMSSPTFGVQGYVELLLKYIRYSILSLVMSEFPKVCKYSSTQAISPQCLNVFTSNLI